MERLTIRNSDGTVSQPTNLNWAEALELLARYEDTGYTPEDFDRLCREMCSMRLAFGIKTFEKLREDFISGRLVKLPYKPGTKLFFPERQHGGVIPFTAHSFVWEDGKLYVMGTHGEGEFSVDECFQTNEEAEAVLRKMVRK